MLDAPPVDYDLFSPTFKADPFPTFAAMRRAAPVYPHQAPDGATIWYVTRYEDVMTVLRDNQNFVKDVQHARPSRPALYSSPSRSVHPGLNQNMLFADPPAHTRLRALVGQAFTPRRVKGMESAVQATADALLDAASVRPEMDLIADFALPLPVIVICDLLGVPAAEREPVREWSQAVISPGSRGLNYSARKRRIRAFLAYLRQLFAERRAQPRDDLITALLQAEEAGGDRLTEHELTSMVALLIVTGHETTVNLIGNGALALLQQPDQRARLAAEPALIDNAVEEILRYDGPVETSTTRWAAADVWLGGQLIRRGDVVRVVLSSANRDEAQFEAADELNIGRNTSHHLAFGHGIHYCLGAPLARLEGRIALPALFTRFPNLRLAQPDAPLAWRSGVLFRGLETLPLLWG